MTLRTALHKALYDHYQAFLPLDSSFYGLRCQSTPYFCAVLAYGETVAWSMGAVLLDEGH